MFSILNAMSIVSYHSQITLMRSLGLFLTTILFACSSTDDAQSQEAEIYFPSTVGTWETVTPQELGWEMSSLDEFYTFLEDNNTRAFVVLHRGRIVAERYWGDDFFGDAFDETSTWYWASASKALTASMIGMAQEKGLLSISNPTSNYLGMGWTSMDASLEQQITVRDQLTMTTGLEYENVNLNCTDPSCLTYRNNPGITWYYHNAPYSLLRDVIANASGQDINTYTDMNVMVPIGASSGMWRTGMIATTYWSNARDLARFGLLHLAQGNWDGEQLVPQEYLQDMVSPSQNLNPSYGYLWWLNGQASVVYPGVALSIQGSLSPSAPADLFAGLGKDGQIVDVIPSRELVVVRMGDAPGGDLVGSQFHEAMWQRLAPIIN